MSGEARADLELALRAVHRAGRVVLEQFGGEHEVALKGPDQPVTAADRDADRALRDELGGERPDYGWLSEETADDPDRLARERVWIVDPIDGTRSFIAGLPEFAISVGLAERGEPLVGVLHNPAAGETYWAVRGGGAYPAQGDEEPVRLSVRRNEPGPVVMLASRSEIAAGEFEPFQGDDWDVRPVGSTAYKLARVAAGAGDAFVSRGPKSEWDVCAGALIVAEAGGRATDLRGEPFRYNRPDPRVYGTIAARPDVHERVLAVVERLDPPRRLVEPVEDPLHPGLDVKKED